MSEGMISRGMLTLPGERTMLGVPACRDLDRLDAKVGLIGIPYDNGSQPPLPSGQNQGPAAVRQNNILLWLDMTEVEWVDVDTGDMPLQGYRMADCGDVWITGGQVEENLARISEVARRIAAAGALVAAVGGDHSVSFPVGRGACERYEKVHVVHFDAHTDFIDDIDGSKYSHGSNLRRLSELPYVNGVTALGLRNVDRSQYEGLVEYGATLASARAFYREDPAALIRRTVPESDYLYVSIDTDVLDAALVPGTTMPEPGGLTYLMLIEALSEVTRRGQVIGFDVVELNPPHDHRGLTARITNWVIFEFLAAIARRAPDGIASSEPRREREAFAKDRIGPPRA
jgi:agmatinase